ncbi:hypothetical protein [Tepidibacter sp. Z1-5]|uniref:hypothetical protein n=1 Tax=Tepidibacter sp. Z1-5 TaxID=3134138 RepID=UPI0030BE8229
MWKNKVFNCIRSIFITLVFLVFSTVSNPEPIYFLAPTETEIELSEEGTYVLYQEYKSDYEGKYVEYPQIKMTDLKFKVFDGSMNEVSVREYIRGKEHRYLKTKSILAFDIKKEGRYKFVVDLNTNVVLFLKKEKEINYMFYIVACIISICAYFIAKKREDI